MQHRNLAGALALAMSCLNLSCSSPLPAPEASDTPAAAQSRVFIDPQTGERRAPTAEERAAAQAGSASRAKPAATPVQIITLPDGTRQAIMHGQDRSYSRAVVDEQGKVHRICDGAHADDDGAQP